MFVFDTFVYKNTLRQSSTAFQAKMSHKNRVSIVLLVIFWVYLVSSSSQQQPLRTCEKDEYSESKLLELLGVQTPNKDCVEEEKKEFQTLIKDIFRSGNGSNYEQTTPQRNVSEANEMMCSTPGNDDLKHTCCPVGQWPDKDGSCQSLF